jgi:hypothetical protein
MSGFASAQLSPTSDSSRYGGPPYTGEPSWDMTAGFVGAGGGAKTFSTATAFTAMLGQQTIAKELIKLKREYGETRVKQWFVVFDFAIDDALKQATAAGVTLPDASLSGQDLATAMVKASMDKHGTVWSELFLDKAVGHDVHMKVMDDIDQKFSAEDDKDYHRITDQALYDIGKTLGVDGVRLARLH